jgi:NAD(P)-dependent dehydrogenase (short-subunit alcohol dehydrogenase family)
MPLSTSRQNPEGSEMSLFDLTGKVALVTGSTKGIGAAIVHRFAEHGAKVVVSSRKADACERVAAAINNAHGKGEEVAAAIPCNISYKEQLQQLVAQTRAKWGRIDVLVCNAALNPYFGPQMDIPDEAFDKIMAANVRSNHWLCQLVLPEMVERKDGSVIIVSSIGGLRGSAVLGAYCISKAADLQLARNIAVEYGPHNIRANCIAPGLIKTDFARALWDNPDILKRSTENAPLRRIGESDEIAGAAVFLASKAGAFTTGQAFVIDGGATIA